MNSKIFVYVLIFAGFLAALAACSTGLAAPVTLETSTPVPASTPEVGIAYPSIGDLSSPTQAYPAPAVSPTVVIMQQPQAVTLEDEGKTIMMKVGDRFLLNLGTGIYEWTLSIGNQTVLSRVKNVMTIQGSQGLFETLKAGSTLLHADGDPLCAQAKPACKMPSRLFTITVVVE
jgi:ABC-type transport system substrate-binding protein